MVTLEKIQKETRWVAKMSGYRMTGTYDEIGHLSQDEDCRDFDVCAEQPDDLKDFWEKLWAYDREHKTFSTIPEFYKIYTEERR